MNKLFYITIIGIFLVASCSLFQTADKTVTKDRLDSVLIETLGMRMKQGTLVGPNSIINYRLNDTISKETLNNLQWIEIQALVEPIEITELSSLNVPSVMHQADQDKAEVLTITYNGEEYKSATYDHSNPPAELKPLILYINELNSKKKK